MSAPRVVVIGAGAVGVSVADALKAGGAHLTFLVREKYAAATRAGIQVYRLPGFRPHLLVPDDVITDVTQLTGRAVDQIWVCLATTGVTPEWLAAVRAAGGEAAVIDLSADGERRIKAAFGARAVEGGVPFIAYQTPLPGVDSEAARPPGIAIWIPPMAALPLSGPRALDAQRALKAGGMRARVTGDAGFSRAMGSAFFNTFVAHLELADWSLPACRARIDAAAAEALDVAVTSLGPAPLFARVLSKPFWMRLGLMAAPVVIPIPLEPYLRFHFTKVGGQTRRSLAGMLEKARALGKDTPALAALVAGLQARDSTQKSGVSRPAV